MADDEGVTIGAAKVADLVIGTRIQLL